MEARFDNYRDNYENVRMKREDGVLEVALHTRGGPLVFNGYVHEVLVQAFRDIGDDPGNHVVILTGASDEFCAQISPEGFDFFTPTGYDKILREGTKILESILDIEVPMIAAVNGPVTVHSGVRAPVRHRLGGRRCLLSGRAASRFRHRARRRLAYRLAGRHRRDSRPLFPPERTEAQRAEAKEYGAVNEVLPREALLSRAWALARHQKKQSPLTLRYTRMALSTRFRRRLQESLSYGLALEGMSAAQVAASNSRQSSVAQADRNRSDGKES
jgi:enoyl-CoA hydratase/carnithine racemase